MLNSDPVRPRWHRIHTDLPREHGHEPLRVEGAVPADLRGTLYRNGPSRFQVGGEPYVHAFDGDGAITAIRLGEGPPTGACRLLRTDWLAAEEAAGQHLYRSYAQLGVGWRRYLAPPKNQANIAVLAWKGQTWALWEFGHPIAFDPQTLACRGPEDIGGQLGSAFGAHPHRLGDAVFQTGLRFGPRFSLDLYALKGELRRITTLPLRFPTLIHDFAVTERWFILFCPPRHLHVGALAAGQRPFIENLRWEPERGTEIILVSREAPHRVTRFTVPAFFLWHFVGAWEEGDELVVDYIRYDDDATDAWFGRAPWAIEPVPPSRLMRARIHPGRETFTERLVSDRPLEFASIHPDLAGKPYRECFALSWSEARARSGGPPALARTDTDTGEVLAMDLGPDTFPSEPLLAPRPGGGAWVLSLVYDGSLDRSYLAVLDGARWGEPPVAKLWFDHAIPLTFHGAWVGSEQGAPGA